MKSFFDAVVGAAVRPATVAGASRRCCGVEVAIGHKRWRMTAVHCLVLRSTVHQVRTSLVVSVACTASAVIHLSPNS